jgi:hypothetical protein
MTKKIVKLHGGTRGTHGGYSYLLSGRLPEHRNEVERYLTGAREGLIRDIGPKEDDLTTAQAILIGRVIAKLGVLRCVEEYIRERSIFVGAELAPCLGKSYLAYSNSVRLDLCELGVSTRAGERMLGPLEIAAEIDREKETAEKARAESVGPEPSSTIPPGAEAKEEAGEGQDGGSGGEAEP